MRDADGEGFINLKRDTVGTLLRMALRQLQVPHIIIPSSAEGGGRHFT
jgi:hypothetical protein